jgi:hypothetical protein
MTYMIRLSLKVVIYSCTQSRLARSDHVAFSLCTYQKAESRKHEMATNYMIRTLKKMVSVGTKQ